MNKETITKLLKSSNPDDNLLGLELQYQAFKHGYTNWYKRGKYNREFRKRIVSILEPFILTHKFDPHKEYLKVGNIMIANWFKARLEEDLKDNML